MKDFSVELNGRTLEYFDDCHLYLVDGVIVPSITTILQPRSKKKYEGVDKEVLRQAARQGTAVHEAIEAYYETGEEQDLPEVRGFKFLQKTYQFKVDQNEVPVILEVDGFVCAGRLDLTIWMDGLFGLADIKRTATLDREMLAYQLNLYRMGYEQSYDKEVHFLKGIHLRDDVRRMVDIPINEELTKEIIKEWREQNE